MIDKENNVGYCMRYIVQITLLDKYFCLIHYVPVNWLINSYLYQWPGKATGETKKKQSLPKARKPKAEPGYYIGS